MANQNRDAGIELKQLVFLAEKKSELKILLTENRCSPHHVIDFLKREIFLKTQYNSDSGVFEGYTLGEHTVMALTQFEKYFAHSPLPAGISICFFRFFLALHDIGKPLAIGAGDKKRQHEFTVQVLPGVFEAYDFDKNDIALALALVDGDTIGAFLRDKISLQTAVEHIHINAKKSLLPLGDFFSALRIYYLCDAGSYTRDSGGIESLDYLFDFDHVHWRMDFKAAVRAKFEILEKAVLSFTA